MTGVAMALVALCVAAEVVHELSFKIAADRAALARSYLAGVAVQPWLWLGIAVWLIEAVAWVFVLQTVPLTVAFPIMTLTYAGVPLIGALFLRERLAFEQAVGIVLIMCGVLCVGLTGA